MTNKWVIGTEFTTDELLKMCPIEDGNVFVNFPELEKDDTDVKRHPDLFPKTKTKTKRSSIMYRDKETL